MSTQEGCVTEHIIERYHKDRCPHCGGHLSCTLQGSICDPHDITQYDRCVCEECGKRFNAESKEYMIGFRSDDGYKMHGVHQWACPECGSADDLETGNVE